MNNINNQIKARRVKLASKNGIVETDCSVALELALDQGLDLVQVTDDAIPVVKIYDYHKSLYEQKKNKKDTKKPVIKEIQFSSDTQQHDLAIKKSQIVDFLRRGYQVKIMMKITTSKRNTGALDMANGVFDDFVSTIGEYAIVQQKQKTNTNYFIWIKKV